MKRILLISFCSVIFLMVAPLHAELRLPAILSDHAMLQADKPIAIWGWAMPGAQVKVTFVENSSPANAFTVMADASGKWSGQLTAMKAGTTGQLQISSDRDNPKTVNDLLIGEVWLGGGQSNMEYIIGTSPINAEEAVEIKQNILTAQKEAEELKQPIRYFKAVREGADKPLDDVKGHWVQADSKNVSTFSAVAWNFAIALQNKLHVPIGLIVSCVGGTPVESWMSRETLEKTSAGAAAMERANKALAEYTPEKAAQLEAAVKAWNEANPTPEDKYKNHRSYPGTPRSATDGRMPSWLYNGMIHGLMPYSLRGIIWFQADGNGTHPFEYPELFQALIKEWRAEWKEVLPFFFVEMTNIYAKQIHPVQPYSLNSLISYCIIREQQHAGLLQPKVGMVATIDLGTENPHYPHKKPVGERLAGLALRDCYGQSMGQVDSPIYKGFSIEGNKIRLMFTRAEGLRVRGGGDLKGFAIRGSSGAWVWATGRVDGQDIVVWSDQIPQPVAVRYAWADNPIISVENGAGLPLFPFRTDTESKE